MSRTIRRKNAYNYSESKASNSWYHRWILSSGYSEEEIQRRLAEDEADTKKRNREFRTDNGWCTGLVGKPIKEETRDRGARSCVRQECQRLVREGDYDGFDPDQYNAIMKYSRWVGW